MEPDTNPSDDIKSRGANRKTTRVLFVLIFVATIFALYFYREVRILESDPSETVTKEISTLVLKVGKLIELPSGELPVRATIKDIAPLTGNPFFANARVGDEVGQDLSGPARIGEHAIGRGGDQRDQSLLLGVEVMLDDLVQGRLSLAPRTVTRAREAAPSGRRGRTRMSRMSPSML